VPSPLQDEFTNLDITRQRRYQLRHEKAKVCRACPKKAVEGSSYCPRCLKKQRRLCSGRERKPNPMDLV